MGSIAGATIEGFNAFVDEQRKIPGARFGLTQFDHDGGKSCIDVIYLDTPLEQVGRLDRNSYQPRGGTPLYDAIGVTITALKERAPAGKVVFVIVTDGEENQSQEWTHQKVFDLIAERRAAGWEFAFLGANVDAYAMGGSMGLAHASSRQYQPNHASVMAAYASVSAATMDYRTGRTSAMTMAPEEDSVGQPAGPLSGAAASKLWFPQGRAHRARAAKVPAAQGKVAKP